MQQVPENICRLFENRRGSWKISQLTLVSLLYIYIGTYMNLDTCRCQVICARALHNTNKNEVYTFVYGALHNEETGKLHYM